MNIYKFMKLLRQVIINNIILPYTDVCIALHTRCFPRVCESTSHATRAGFEPTISVITSADRLILSTTELAR